MEERRGEGESREVTFVYVALWYPSNISLLDNSGNYGSQTSFSNISLFLYFCFSVVNMLRAFPSWDASKHHLW